MAGTEARPTSGLARRVNSSTRMKLQLIWISMTLLTAAASASIDRPGRLSAQDKATVEKMAHIGATEVILGQLAAEHAQSPDVKTFAEQMVRDHGAANEELKALATDKQVTLPTALDKRHKDLVDRLARLDGTRFDREYTNAMVSGHKDAITLFERAATKADDKDLRAWSDKTLPTLKHHLEMAERAQRLVEDSTVMER